MQAVATRHMVHRDEYINRTSHTRCDSDESEFIGSLFDNDVCCHRPQRLKLLILQLSLWT